MPKREWVRARKCPGLKGEERVCPCAATDGQTTHIAARRGTAMSYRFVLVALLTVSSAQADTINVGPGDSIQTAIDYAVDTDEIVVASGTCFENINFNGKAITVEPGVNVSR